jgi:hypothetical protein
MVNEKDLPQFQAGIAPIGTPMATRKQSAGLMKVLRAHAKAKGPESRHSGRKSKPKKKGLASDQDVHFGNRRFY